MAKQLCRGCYGENPENCVWCEGTGYDTDFTEQPVCPHCGEPCDMDSPDNYDEFVLTCEYCEKDFTVYPYVKVSYRTRKVEVPHGNQ